MFYLKVAYVSRENNTVADCFSRWVHEAGKTWMYISMHGDTNEAAAAKRIIMVQSLLVKGKAK